MNNINKKVLGIITARGGSKGVPRKNVKPLLGKPLIAYTIESAKESGVLDRLILSSEDPEIIEVAKQYGCEAPFVRPAELAEDNTQHLQVVQHAVKWLKDNEGYNPDYVMILQPTAPLRQPFHIREAVDLILKTSADSVTSVAKIPDQFNPYKTMLIGNDGFLRLATGNRIYKRVPRRQDLPLAYYSIGTLYLFRTDLLFRSDEPNFYGEKAMPYVIDWKYLADIDIPEDWQKAEEAMKNL